VDDKEAEAFRALVLRVGLDETNRLEQFLKKHGGTVSATRDESFVLNDVPIAFGAPIGQRHVSRQVVHRLAVRPAAC
jgi:hypothetical protein